MLSITAGLALDSFGEGLGGAVHEPTVDQREGLGRLGGLEAFWATGICSGAIEAFDEWVDE